MSERIQYIKTADSMHGVGDAATYALGTGATSDIDTPADVSATKTWASVAISQYAAAGVTTDGKLWTVGTDTGAYGVLADGSTGGTQTSWTQVGSDTDWTTVYGPTGTGNTFLAIKSGGTLYGWGKNTEHELGLGADIANKSTPTQIGSDTDWSAAAAMGDGLSGAIKTGNTLYVWGDQVSNNTPTQVGSGTDWAFISGGGGIANTNTGGGAVLIKTDGTLYGFGYNNGTRFTTGPGAAGTFINPPGLIDSGEWQHASTFSEFSSGASDSYAYMVAVKSDGTLWGCGGNGGGDTTYGGWLGDGSATDRTTLVQESSGGTSWSICCAAGQNSYAITTGGAIYACGAHANGSGGCGQGATGINAYLTYQSMDTAVDSFYGPPVYTITIPSSPYDITTGGVETFTLTVTGDGISTDDVDIPMSSFNCSLRNTNQSYLTCVVPGLSIYATYITDRLDQTAKITHVRMLADGSTVTHEICDIAIATMRIDQGGTSQSITITANGASTLTSLREITIPDNLISYINQQSNAYRYRIPFTPEIRAGDTLTINSETITVGNVQINVNSAGATMEITPDLDDGTVLDDGSIVVGTSGGGYVYMHTSTA